MPAIRRLRRIRPATILVKIRRLIIVLEHHIQVAALWPLPEPRQRARCHLEATAALAVGGCSWLL